jgi:hypothetical protein
MARTATCPKCGATIQEGQSSCACGAKITWTRSMPLPPWMLKLAALGIGFGLWNTLFIKILGFLPPAASQSISNFAAFGILAFLYKKSMKFWPYTYLVYVLTIAFIVSLGVSIYIADFPRILGALTFIPFIGAGFWWKGKCDAEREDVQEESSSR